MYDKWGLRVYKTDYSTGKGKTVLFTWMDKHCKTCGRFLTKKNRHDVCNECAKVNRKVREKEYKKNNLEYKTLARLRRFVWWNINKINIGDVI